MKLSAEQMKKRVEFAERFFQDHPEASVAELNKKLEEKGEPKMGMTAYEVKDAVKRVRRGKPAVARAPVMDEVTAMIGTLAKRLSGTNIKKVLLDVSGESPVIRYTELEPKDREVTLKS